MKKKKCVLCTQKRGRRICKLHSDEMVCSLCCAKSRGSDCEGCVHYEAAEQYAASKARKPKPKHFIAEINEEVENTVDRALALVEKGAIEKGEAIILKLKKDHPRNHTIYFGLGVVSAFKKQHDEAIKHFDRAIDIFPYFIEAHFNKGVAYKEKLDITNTIESFKEVVAIGDPGDELVQQAKKFIDDMEQHIVKTIGIGLEIYLECEKKFNEAFSYMEKQEWEKAIEGFKTCLAKNKKHPQTYGNIGLCYAYLGQKEQALAAFDKALKIDPDYEPALLNRMAIESLKEGEGLERANLQFIEYYKDYPLKKRSLIQSMKKSLIQSMTQKLFGL